MANEDHKTIYVTELDRVNGHHVLIHRFQLPNVGESGFYRSTVSYNAFFNSIRSKNKTKTRLFNARHVDEWKLTKKLLFADKSPTIVDHDSIWAFYKYIGYDYKTKKWTRLGPA